MFTVKHLTALLSSITKFKHILLNHDRMHIVLEQMAI